MIRWIASLAAALIAGLVLAAPKDAVPEFATATVLEGKSKERGHVYGKQFRDEIRDFFKTEILAAFVGKPATKEQMLGYAKACARVVKAECPVVAEEFEGIADGAGLTFDEIVLINLHEELYHRTPLPRHGHCTAVAIGPPDTSDRHAFVG